MAVNLFQSGFEMSGGMGGGVNVKGLEIKQIHASISNTFKQQNMCLVCLKFITTSKKEGIKKAWLLVSADDRALSLGFKRSIARNRSP